MTRRPRMSRSEWEQHWLATRHPLDDLSPYRDQLMAIIQQVRRARSLTAEEMSQIVRRHPYEGRRTFNKNQLVRAYRGFCEEGVLPFERDTLRKLQRKPIRTASGVAPVTVLTEPFPCPGNCIFCPDVQGQPKSYLPDEPGAARAASFCFDPFAQTAGRIATFEALGHNAEKVELLILGGSWSAYPPDYQEWFIRRCLDAMNGREASTLSQAQADNEIALHRNVGLVVETRPDMITPAEIVRLRRLGVTKVQLGVQSLDDRILTLNRRDHSVADTQQALRLLRLGGFKIVVHWMPNLYGATPDSDRKDFQRLWDDPALRPDELKIYPTALLEGTDLYRLWQAGDYAPYPEDVLIDLVADCKTLVPPYCRINRIMRDIPAGNIVAGTTKSNLRQIAQRRLQGQGRRCRCLRCSEIRGRDFQREQLELDDLVYRTDATQEHFLRFLTPDQRTAGLLRLSLPAPEGTIILELAGHAMIREVHVYGPALAINSASQGEAQHRGLGEELIERATEIAQHAGFRQMAVIAAIGTRDYYRRFGFALSETELYMTRSI
jgi:elongator complex protein 3